MTPDQAKLYLILHKVRGEAAFDVAERFDLNGEEAWVIPTSGHRAYPYGFWDLRKLLKDDNCMLLIPNDWPDHYAANDKAEKLKKVTKRLNVQLSEGEIAHILKELDL